MKTISERDVKIAIDIADTLTHYRRDCGCFPTINSIQKQIETELSVRPVNDKSYARMMVEDVMRQHDEWFDKECEPE